MEQSKDKSHEMTEKGRQLVSNAIKYCDQHNLDIIYGDTDGLIVTNKKERKENGH